MGRKQRIIYYEDELKDEFAGDSIQPRAIDSNYQYIREDFAGKLSHLFWYRMIAVPLAKIYMKLYFGHKIVNKSVLEAYRDRGYFLYGNHTHFLADALVPTLVSLPKDVFVIVHPNNVSMPVLGKITPSLGALPLPDDGGACKNFVKAIAHRIRQKHCIMIYPEAHIWPYYTDIRPFTDASFRYPVKYQVPAFCLTNTYQKRKHRKHPRMVTYVDGPFFPDTERPAAEQKQMLRNQVYAKMKERALENSVVQIRYERKKHSTQGG